MDYRIRRIDLEDEQLVVLTLDDKEVPCELRRGKLWDQNGTGVRCAIMSELRSNPLKVRAVPASIRAICGDGIWASLQRWTVSSCSCLA